MNGDSEAGTFNCYVCGEDAVLAEDGLCPGCEAQESEVAFDDDAGSYDAESGDGGSYDG